MTADEWDVLISQWLDCADDLERWARAFATDDPESADELRLRAQEMRTNASCARRGGGLTTGAP